SPASTPPPSRDPQQKKPNILFILADQVSAPLLRIHNASSPIKTPHIDALAAKSAVFSSAYCASPLCAPSRSSLVTGQLPSRIGAWDNASPLGVEVPTYAHYLRREGYETVLAGKMHFIGEQLHGYEERLTSDIYPGDFGWAVNWDEPDRRLEWYHNASSILQAGPCIRSNQLDFDEEVMYKSTRYLYAAARRPATARPFCLTVSLTHPHDPYTIHREYWDRYEGEDIPLPEVNISKAEQDEHSKRLLQVCELWDEDMPEEAIKRARRAYFGAVSYVDDNVGKLLHVLKECGMDEDTIVIFSADHGDMLGERGLWYKMSFHEASARVPLLVSYAKLFNPTTIPQSVSSIDILPTLVEMVNGRLDPRLPMDGNSLMPHLHGYPPEDDSVYGEYCGEGTIAPLMMIRRGPWKLVVCPTDPPQLFNLQSDPKELFNLATSSDPLLQETFVAFMKEANERWDFKSIHAEVLKSQRTRRVCWDALKQGRFESWDYAPNEKAANQYIRSNVPLDELELRARYPPVDAMGREKKRGDAHGVAAAYGQ
ncbi:choline-sulfatase, partial [Lecanoromycetidae sp. Uapishka_2]